MTHVFLLVASHMTFMYVYLVHVYEIYRTYIYFHSYVTGRLHKTKSKSKN